MSDSKKDELRSSDDEDKIPKSSNTKENDETSIDNEKSKKCEELISENKNIFGESSMEIDTNNEKTSNAVSDVTTSEDSTPPVSICFKETNEFFSEESQKLMIEDVRNFFLNLKELQSKRASTETLKRKLDSGEKSDLRNSEECTQPAKKLLLDTSTSKGISHLQSPAISQNSEPCAPAAAVSMASISVGSLLTSVFSGAISQAPGVIDHSTESHSQTGQAGTSSEDPSSSADQPNATEDPRNENNHLVSQSATTNPPAEPMEYDDQPLVELNGVRSHCFPGVTEVEAIVPLFQCFLNDILEVGSFLRGLEVPSAIPEGADASAEVAYSDRQLASIPVEFETGVESDQARLTKDAVTEWDTKYLTRVDSECLSGYSEQSEFSEDSTLSVNSTHRTEHESNSNEVPESSASPNLSPDPIPSCSESDAAVLTTKPPQLNPETAHSNTLENKEELPTTDPESSSNRVPENTTNPSDSEPTPTDSLQLHAELACSSAIESKEELPTADNPVQSIEPESSSNRIPENITNSSDSGPTPTDSLQLHAELACSRALESKEELSTSENPVQCIESESSSNKVTTEETTNPSDPEPTPTDSQPFHAELDHLNLPSEISALLDPLNKVSCNLLNSCIATSKNFLRALLVNGIDYFQGTLLEHMRGMLDTMRRLISIREECSDLLKKCPDKNSFTGVTYILKVKYYIAKVHNQLLEDFLAMNSDFHEVVKEKLPIDNVD